MKKMWMNHAAVRTAQIKNHQGAEHLRRMAACEEAALCCKPCTAKLRACPSRRCWPHAKHLAKTA